LKHTPPALKRGSFCTKFPSSLDDSRSLEVMKRKAQPVPSRRRQDRTRSGPEHPRGSALECMTKRIVGSQRSNSRLWARGLREILTETEFRYGKIHYHLIPSFLTHFSRNPVNNSAREGGTMREHRGLCCIRLWPPLHAGSALLQQATHSQIQNRKSKIQNSSAPSTFNLQPSAFLTPQ
jgi:hypothetical protein